jgi:hypothetical protein
MRCALPKTVHFDSYKVQDQQKFVWPPSFALARAYVDQLERSKGLSAGEIQAVRDGLSAAEKAKGSQRRIALIKIALQLNGDVSGPSDPDKVKLVSAAVNDLSRRSDNFVNKR